MKFIWLLVIATSVCDAYKILVLFPIPAGSHNILGWGIVNPLVEAGHEVTYVTPFPKKNQPSNLRQLDVSAVNKLTNNSDAINIQAIMDKKAGINLGVIFEMITMINEKIVKESAFANVLKDNNEKFDVVISEWMFTNIYSALGPVFGCPFIWVSTVEPHWMILRMIDELTNPAYVPDIFSGNVPPFNFKERVTELFLMGVGTAMNILYFNSYEQDTYNKLLAPYIRQRGREVHPYNVVKYNASLFLGNSHPSFGLPTRLPQNYKQIGGYHIDSVVKPLPDDLKKLLDDSKNGLIYFSMGSNLKSKDIPEVLKKGLLKLFSGLKQTVLWKFEEVLPSLPDNVHIVDWAPQQSILAHPNCVLFITHGGLLSTTETVHFGKPIVGIPVFADQFNNIDKAVKKGYAIRVDLSYDMIGELEVAIKEVLNSPRYTQVVKQLSAIYHDRPISPKKELVYWVEHVVRTNGALHLRSPALHVPFYQKMYLDLAAIVIAIIFVLKITIRRLCCSTKKVDKNKKRN